MSCLEWLFRNCEDEVCTSEQFYVDFVRFEGFYFTQFPIKNKNKKSDEK